MTRSEAKEILTRMGWNEDGADAILDEIQELDEMTVDELKKLSGDYMDR